MISEAEKKKFYRALLERDREFDGVFYVGVKTTGVFCRPTCPARKPKFENCEFFKTAKWALDATYRPCQRCKPLSNPDAASDIVQKLIDAIEACPEKHWKEADFRALSTNAPQASRLFKKRFGITFVAYARARRMGIAMKQIKEKSSILDTQLDVGYESGSGFRDAFSKIMGAPPAKSAGIHTFVSTWIDTPLGPMIAIADQEALVLLEFVSRRGLEKEIEKLRQKGAILPGNNQHLQLIQKELSAYFKGKLVQFTTPIKVFGTPFQRRVWDELKRIPSGETRSYAQLAKAVESPNGHRAVAQANGANQLAIIIPCHRVINASGELGGYGGGVERKKWLLEHESK